jgi:hypothetical protein
MLSAVGCYGPEENFGVEIGDAFAQNLACPFTVAPPMVRIILRTGHGDDAGVDILAESLRFQSPLDSQCTFGYGTRLGIRAAPE